MICAEKKAVGLRGQCFSPGYQRRLITYTAEEELKTRQFQGEKILASYLFPVFDIDLSCHFISVGGPCLADMYIISCLTFFLFIFFKSFFFPFILRVNRVNEGYLASPE